MASVPFDDINKTLRDGLYIGVGLGVIAFQKAQVQRQELRKQARAVLHEAGEVAEDAVAQIVQLARR